MRIDLQTCPSQYESIFNISMGRVLTSAMSCLPDTSHLMRLCRALYSVSKRMTVVCLCSHISTCRLAGPPVGSFCGATLYFREVSLDSDLAALTGFSWSAFIAIFSYRFPAVLVSISCCAANARTFLMTGKTDDASFAQGSDGSGYRLSNTSVCLGSVV